MAQILPVTPSLLNTFLTCPKQYEAKYITKKVVFEPTEAAAYGDRVHKSVEDTLVNGAALLPEAEYMSPLVKFCRELAAREGVTMEVEKSLAITKDLAPCGWWGPRRGKSAWMRGKADVFFRDDVNKRNIIIDWKTGKVKDDRTQSDILATCATRYTGYTKNICIWAFVTKDDAVITNVDLINLLPVQDTLQAVARYEQACINNHFPATRNGLCGNWCDVISCEHNGKAKK